MNPACTKRIVGLTPVESLGPWELFFEQIIRPEYTVRFRREPDSVAFWDNRSTAHLAAVDLNHLDVSRTMHRVTILGDCPVCPDGFVSEVVAGEPLLAFQH